MGEELKGITIIDTIRPKNTESDYATHQSTYGKGGWHEVNTIDERNSIISSRRTNGMAVFVTETQKLYTLNAQDITVTKLTDADWNQFTLSGDMSVSSLNVNGTISAKNIQTTQNISANNYFFNNGDNVSTLITSASATAINTITGSYLQSNYMALTGGNINGSLKITNSISTNNNISANAYYITNVGNITLLSTTAINTITGSYLKDNYLPISGGTITNGLSASNLYATTDIKSGDQYLNAKVKDGGTITNDAYNANYNEADIHYITISDYISITVTNLPQGCALIIRITITKDNITIYTFGKYFEELESGIYYIVYGNTTGTTEVIGQPGKI